MQRLLNQGRDHIVVVDNFSQSRENIIDDPRVEYHEIDIRDRDALTTLFTAKKPVSVLHFAALANVPDSVADPAGYYDHNVTGSLNLLNAMKEAGTKQIVFSSSASVYGEPTTEIVSEDHPKKPTNPYGRTKLIMEEMLADYGLAYGISSISLRYFCAAGCDPSGKLGPHHSKVTHIIPRILGTIVGTYDKFFVYGNDFNTPDGTGVRDYIHVSDLADAHLKAIEKLSSGEAICEQYNLGINKGFSVLEMIKAAESVTGQKVPFEIKDRRPGDPARLIANADRAKRELGWQPQYLDIEEIIRTAYEFTKNHP